MFKYKQHIIYTCAVISCSSALVIFTNSRHPQNSRDFDINLKNGLCIIIKKWTVVRFKVLLNYSVYSILTIQCNSMLLLRIRSFYRVKGYLYTDWHDNTCEQQYAFSFSPSSECFHLEGQETSMKSYFLFRYYDFLSRYYDCNS